MKLDIVLQTQRDLLAEQTRLQQLKLTEKTPIYFDEPSNKFYYPEVALFEKEALERATKEMPLLFDPESGFYFAPESKTTRYVEVRNEEEFLEMRVKALEKEERRRLVIGLKTPVFVNDDGWVYYPERALMEEDLIVREVVTDDFPLRYDAEEDVYFEIVTKERYLEFGSEADFEQQRLKTLTVAKARELLIPEIPPSQDIINFAIETPIYHDSVTGKYHYPIIIAIEDPSIPRAIYEEPLPRTFTYNEHTNQYKDPITGELYQSFTSPEEFETFALECTKRTLAEIDQDRADATPIYKDRMDYYYPKSALYQTTAPERFVIEKRPEFQYDPLTQIYLNENGEEYIKVVSPEKFEDFMVLEKKKRKNERLKKWAKQTPIYLDFYSKKYYYPKSALEEPEDLHR